MKTNKYDAHPWPLRNLLALDIGDRAARVWQAAYEQGGR